MLEETAAGANGFSRQKPGQVDCSQSQKALCFKVNNYLGPEAQGQHLPSVASSMDAVSLGAGGRGCNIRGQTSSKVI